MSHVKYCKIGAFVEFLEPHVTAHKTFTFTKEMKEVAHVCKTELIAQEICPEEYIDGQYFAGEVLRFACHQAEGDVIRLVYNGRGYKVQALRLAN